MAWAMSPPQGGPREAWVAAIIECAAKGDVRFIPILEQHVKDGHISAERAGKVLRAAVAELQGYE